MPHAPEPDLNPPPEVTGEPLREDVYFETPRYDGDGIEITCPVYYDNGASRMGIPYEFAQDDEDAPDGIVWVTFTRRTNDPKLAWLQDRLRERNIPSRREGESYHAPILLVRLQDLTTAWEVLTPEIDDAPDDDARFC